MLHVTRYSVAYSISSAAFSVDVPEGVVGAPPAAADMGIGAGGASTSAVKSSRSLVNSDSNASSSALNVGPGAGASGGVEPRGEVGAEPVAGGAGAEPVVGGAGAVGGVGGEVGPGSLEKDTGESSSTSQSSSSLVDFAIPGARKLWSQCGHFTLAPAAFSATETAPLQRGH